MDDIASFYRYLMSFLGRTNNDRTVLFRDLVVEVHEYEGPLAGCEIEQEFAVRLPRAPRAAMLRIREVSFQSKQSLLFINSRFEPRRS